MTSHNPMTQEQLDAIRERVEVATDGPWAVDSDDPSYIIHPERGGWDGLVIAQVADQDGALLPVEHNGALIAHAPQDLADLLAEVARLRALTTVDDDMVERAARAYFEDPIPSVDASLRPKWDPLVAAYPGVADNYRRHMRAALDVALGTGEGS